MKPPSPGNRFPTAPNKRVPATVCLRQPVPLRELSTLDVAAAWRLARCCQPALVVVRVLLVRLPDAQFALKIRLAKHVPKNFSAARAEWDGASRRRRLLRGGGARKKAAGECKWCALAHSYSSLCLVAPRLVASCGLRHARGACVCAVPVRSSPIHKPLWLHGRKGGMQQGARL